MKNRRYKIMLFISIILLLGLIAGCSIFKPVDKNKKELLGDKDRSGSAEKAGDEIKPAKGDTKLLNLTPPGSSDEVLTSKSSIYYDPNRSSSNKAENDFIAGNEEAPPSTPGTKAIPLETASVNTDPGNTSHDTLSPGMVEKPTTSPTMATPTPTAPDDSMPTASPRPGIVETPTASPTKSMHGHGDRTPVSVTSRSIPTPDANGDYHSRGHRFWIVVDPDPEGLNGRLALDYPPDWFSPVCRYDNDNVRSWPIIRKFKKGTILVANTTPAGFAMLYQGKGKGTPWLKVDLSPSKRVGRDTEALCFVRANSMFIKPVAPVEKTPSLSLKVAEINDPDGYTNLRSGPGTDHATVARINKGRRFLVLSDRGAWHRVFSMKGQKGFIHKSRIKVNRIDAIGAAVSRRNTDIYKAPSTGSQRIGSIRENEIVCLLAPDLSDLPKNSREPVGSWMKVTTADGLTGYVNTSSKSLRWKPL